MCAQAADELADTGHSFDVIDLRSIFPYDWDTISRSVEKTGRVLIANEDTEVSNFGEHLLRRIIDEHFYDLLVKPVLLTGKHVPGIGLNQVYETNTVPQQGSIREAMRRLAAGSGLIQRAKGTVPRWTTALDRMFSILELCLSPFELEEGF